MLRFRCKIVWVTTLLTVVSVGWGAEVHCPEEGCGNLTVYFNAKADSKIVIYPYNSKHNGSTRGDGKTDGAGNGEAGMSVVMLVEELNSSAEAEPPSVRMMPILEGNTVTAVPPTAGNITTTTSAPVLTLNFTAMNMTAKDVKAALQSQATPDTKYLLLGHNNIQYLPEHTFPEDLEYSARELSLDNNRLRYLSAFTVFEIRRLGNLQKLNLSRTGLYHMSALHMPSLRVLDLSWNEISYLTEDSELTSLANLEELYLEGNQFKYFYNSLSSLQRLRIVSLASNGLAQLSGQAFSTFSNLQRVYLNNNSLTDMKLVQDNFYSGQLYLRGNPWECSCALIFFLKRGWPTVADADNLTCVDPNYLAPRQVRSLTKDDVTIGCRAKWRDWCEDVSREISHWFYRYSPDWRTLTSVLWWGLMVAAVVVLVRSRRQAKKKSAPSEVSYNILDDGKDSKNTV